MKPRMFPSSVNTIEVPVITSPAPIGADAPSPATIIETAKTNCSVKVRNNSFGQYVLLAYDAATLQTFPAKAGTFKLPAGAVDTFVVARGQGLFVATPSGPVVGVGAEVSYLIYQDIPVDDQP